MPVAGDVAAVVEIVENPELPRQLVLIGSDLLAVHGERWIAVGFGEIAEHLIVGAIFLNDVDHMMNFIFVRGEWNAVDIALGGIGCRRERSP